ncbi:hypothetical protein ABZW30_12810 [Kitasatospora sp. NPDC004669]|uniref:hypothetical protein n=1 Tax=Kitasatospora sp. NPDC004669 TaxID=3154555 RepID=UPI0033BDB6E9
MVAFLERALADAQEQHPKTSDAAKSTGSAPKAGKKTTARKSTAQRGLTLTGGSHSYPESCPRPRSSAADVPEASMLNAVRTVMTFALFTERQWTA